MKMKKNLFSNIPHNLQKELIEPLIKTKNCKIERIISKGHATPKGKWYDQKQNEFVLLIKGEADLLVENQKVLDKSSDFWMQENHLCFPEQRIAIASNSLVSKIASPHQQSWHNLITLKKGDYLNIPAHVKHRVERTSEKEETIWLAIFY